jgi:hypothetical protein
MSFLMDAISASECGIYELQEFLRSRCRAVDSDIKLTVGDAVQSISVEFVEGLPHATDSDLWKMLPNLSASSVDINVQHGEVSIMVEFE